MRPSAALPGPRLLIALLFALAPGIASAGGAFLAKGGLVRLADDTQSLDASQLRTFDETSQSTLGLSIEARKRDGVTFGAEFLTFRHDFTPPIADPGEGRVWVMQFMGKKYFIDQGPFHPFIGAGLGPARVRYSYNNAGTKYSDDDIVLTLNATVGLELRFDNLSFMLEARNMYFDTESGKYDPSGVAVLAGFGFNW
jgi:opacity protein-like surface antigen